MTARRVPLLPPAVSLALLAVVSPLRGAPAWREDFTDLARWKPLTFPKIAAHSQYRRVSLPGGTALRCESRASASGLLLDRPIDIRATPRLRFEWKVESVYEGSDPRAKAGDDYPIRIYVFFQLAPQKATLLDRLAKAVYGQWPPHSSLNYVWASAPGDRGKPYPSPYTARLRMLALEGGGEKIGQWVLEEVDLLEDYHLAFGRDPPIGPAHLAVMNDSDNTGRSAVSWLRWIEAVSAP